MSDDAPLTGEPPLARRSAAEETIWALALVALMAFVFVALSGVIR